MFLFINNELGISHCLYSPFPPLSVFSFPSCHFGKLYGLVMALSAVVSLLQYPFFSLVKGALDGDPLYVSRGQTTDAPVNSTYLLVAFTLLNHGLLPLCLQVNIALTVISLLAFIHPASVYLHCRSRASSRAKGQAVAVSS